MTQKVLSVFVTCLSLGGIVACGGESGDSESQQKAKSTAPQPTTPSNGKPTLSEIQGCQFTQRAADGSSRTVGFKSTAAAWDQNVTEMKYEERCGYAYLKYAKVASGAKSYAGFCQAMSEASGREDRLLGDASKAKQTAALAKYGVTADQASKALNCPATLEVWRAPAGSGTGRVAQFERERLRIDATSHAYGCGNRDDNGTALTLLCGWNGD